MPGAAIVRASGKRGVRTSGKAAVEPCPACCGGSGANPCTECGLNCPPSPQCQQACAHCDECEGDCTQACQELDICMQACAEAQSLCLNACENTYSVCTSQCDPESPDYEACLAACEAQRNACFSDCGECNPSDCPTYSECQSCQETCFPDCATCQACRDQQEQEAAYQYIQTNGALDLGTIPAGGITLTVVPLSDLNQLVVSFHAEVTGGGFYRGSVFFAGEPVPYQSADAPFVDLGCEDALDFTVTVNRPLAKCQQYTLTVLPAIFSCLSAVNCNTVLDVFQFATIVSDADIGRGWFRPIGWSWGKPGAPPGSQFPGNVWSTSCIGEASKIIRRTYRYRVNSSASKCLRVYVRHAGIAKTCGTNPKVLLECSTVSELEGSGPDGSFAELQLHNRRSPLSLETDFVHASYYNHHIDAGATPECCGQFTFSFDIEIKVECIGSLDDAPGYVCPAC
ncbi:MAG: hypothetical protein HS116_25410 [Planctomycetes bacterium]|nr:hypothetical protein [Planctomycetota bacterium]